VKLVETVIGYGHENVSATHKSTIEITRDDYLTPRGNCIIMVKADKAVSDLSDEVKNKLRSYCKVKLIIEVDDLREEICGFGHPKLQLTDERSIVIRKSSYICPRTLMINANKAAADLDRKLIEKLKEKGRRGKIIIIIEDQKL